jgi:2-amino-4-hydroxy-6-hydroxymethyldihydropteridine diphosphokinase
MSVCFVYFAFAMKAHETIFLSLGSNMGNKLNSLQNAVFRLGSLGEIQQISPVYKSPSWGFEADPFLNACIEIRTGLTPENILGKILDIEAGMGRERKAEEGYQSRTIDIDLLYYGNKIIRTAALTVPHPQLQERKFVLKPLADIAPQWYHPVLGKDSRNLLQQCRDKATPVKTAHKLFRNREQLLSHLNFIAIEGNIGAGKTSLAQKIAEEYNAKLVLERFADNPFLPKFYEDQGRYAFPLEMSFLADRYQQFTDDTSQFDLFKSFMVSDYDIYKSLIFAKITLQKDEFVLYRKIFNSMYKEVKKPGIYIFLHQQTDRLLENIKMRGREYEQQIHATYLEKINRGYLDFIRSYPEQKSIILDISSLDFVSEKADFEQIMDRIQEQLVNDAH